MVHAIVLSDVVQVASAREVVPKLVEGTGHHAIREVERLLHSVAVVDIDVDLEDPLVLFKQLQDGQHAVVDLAESAGLTLLGMVQTSCPVDRVVNLVIVEQARSCYRS